VKAQFTKKNGKPEWVVLPFAEYERLVEQLEMAQDVRDYDEAMRHIADGEEMAPSEVVDALLEGQNPLRVWRERRGLTQQELAKRAGISKPYLSQLETGKRVGATKILRKLAAALDLTLDDLSA
jgi:DNA-binding XRE family transcriptional regulator